MQFWIIPRYFCYECRPLCLALGKDMFKLILPGGDANRLFFFFFFLWFFQVLHRIISSVCRQEPFCHKSPLWMPFSPGTRCSNCLQWLWQHWYQGPSSRNTARSTWSWMKTSMLSYSMAKRACDSSGAPDVGGLPHKSCRSLFLGVIFCMLSATMDQGQFQFLIVLLV